MNKLLIGILVGLAAIILLLVNLTRVVQGPPERLGAKPDATISRVASTTLDGLGTYFGACCADRIRTSTTTLLTIRGVQLVDSVFLDVTSVATSTTNLIGQTVFILPEVSLDASTWVPVHLETLTNTGTYTDRITLNSGTASTTFAWIPNLVVGTTTTLLPPLKDLGGEYLRVRVWSTGTSTITVGARLLNR